LAGSLWRLLSGRDRLSESGEGAAMMLPDGFWCSSKDGCSLGRAEIVGVEQREGLALHPGKRLDRRV
jgi:hypothetical protein